MATLEARGLHMRFGNRVVLEDISLTFADRRFTGIMGPNGAGKTTTFNVLSGRYRPHRGSVLLDGDDITGEPPRSIARKGVARSFQTMNLFNDFSALENVALAVPEMRSRGFSMLARAAPTRRPGKAEAVLAGVGLRGKEHTQAKNLPTATGARSRSASRWRRHRRCPVSTSRQRDSGARRPRGSAT